MEAEAAHDIGNRNVGVGKVLIGLCMLLLILVPLPPLPGIVDGEHVGTVPVKGFEKGG